MAMLNRIADLLVRRSEGLVTALVLAGMTIFLATFFPPSLVFSDTITVGGDTPAHHYLAGHMIQTLKDGRVIGWAGGWWCGFPMFQYYFTLPYLLIAILSAVLPYAMAFKFITVLGIFITPFCAWTMGRWIRLAYPGPLLLAIATLPFLFVRSHVMWGANIYSTLAGMIANGVSFPLMLLCIGSAWRDAEDGRFRLRTSLLLTLLIASHFFTTVITAVILALLPCLWPRRFFRTAPILVAEGGLAFLLMAWWLVPLIAKQDFSVEFGENWSVQLWKSLPGYKLLAIPIILAGLIAAWRARCRAILLFLWMLIASTFLFYRGFDWAPVFVNVRLWPFLFFAGIALTAVSLGFLLKPLRGRDFFVLALALLAVVYVETAPWPNPGALSSAPSTAVEKTLHSIAATDHVAPNDVRAWAQWNYEGLETKPYWPTLEKLLLPLRGTPGRLCNDLIEDNNVFGSVRIFELTPFLIGKPILEGGIVNSAIGSFYAYYVQGELSKNCAGFPTLVKPTTFNLTNATLHCKLFNVKHCIARWDTLKSALRSSSDWHYIDGSQGWELYELMNHDGRYVTLPECYPIPVRTDRWKEYSLEWLYTTGAIRQPFVFIPNRAPRPADIHEPVWNEAQFRRYIAETRLSQGDIMEWLHLGPFPCPPESSTNPLACKPVDETRADPAEGDIGNGKTWTLLFDAPPIDLYRVHHDTRYIAYSFVNVFSPEEQDAVIHVSHDDAGAVFWNGVLVSQAGNTGLNNFTSIRITLRAGRNRLLHKIYQEEGGAFFQVRITTPDGTPIPGLVATTAKAPPALPDTLNKPVQFSSAAIQTEEVSDTHIRFRTDAIGQPHLIKVSYFPNWKVHGARQVYMVSPAFMLVYPDQTEVELFYGTTASDRLGYVLAGLGGVIALWLIIQRLRRRPGPFALLFDRAAWLKFTDALVGLPLSWILSYIRYLCGRRDIALQDISAVQPRRILVIRPGGMGDLLLLLPSLQALQKAFPAAEIDLICERRNMEVLEIAGWADSALPYDARPFTVLRRLVQRRYDVVIDTEQFHHFSAILSLLSKAPVRIGFKINPARNQLYTHLVNYAMDGMENLQFARLLSPLGISEPAADVTGILRAASFRIPGNPAISDFLKAGPSITLCVGSSTPYKRWDQDRFVALCRRLREHHPNLGLIFVGGAGDQAASLAVMQKLKEEDRSIRAINSAGELSLSETAGIIHSALLFIGGDSGLGHLAVALGTPTVLLFGPSDHQKWGHAGSRHYVIRHSIGCAPCFIFGYHRPCRTIACMKGIGVEAVVDACEKLLSQANVKP